MVKKILRRIFLGIIIILSVSTVIFVIAGLIPTDNDKSIKSYYVTMKDSTKIAVRVTLPDNMKKNEKFPAIIETTRYGTMKENTLITNALINLFGAKVLNPINDFKNSGFVLVAIDSRGSGASFGSRKVVWSKEEINDIYQVIDWITEQFWSNGKVATFGISYSGNTAEYSISTKHDAIFAAAPLYSDYDPYSSLAFPGGIYNKVLIEEWSKGNEILDINEGSLYFKGSKPVDEDEDGKMLKKAVSQRKNFDVFESLNKVIFSNDDLVKGYSMNEFNLENYKEEIEESEVPMYIRVGWHDAGTVDGAINRFLKFNNSQELVIGPWNHGGSQFYDPFIEKEIVPEKLVEDQKDEIVSFYKKCLKNSTSSKEKIIRYYTFGEGKWKTTESWPIKGFENKKMFFGKKGVLSDDIPNDEKGEDMYKVNYSATTGKNNRWFTNVGGGFLNYPDRAKEDEKLLTYTSEKMISDTEITGNPVVTLNVESNISDGAFYVYLEDVAPDGKVTYITEGQIRGIHRKVLNTSESSNDLVAEHSYKKEDSKNLNINKNNEIKIRLYATSVLIEKGHKIRIAVAGHDNSSFIRIMENKNHIIKILMNRELNSYVELPVKTR